MPSQYSAFFIQIRVQYILLFCWIFVVANMAFAQQDEVPSETSTAIVRNIRIDARDIFDPDERVPLAGLINFIHIRTQKKVIRRELLFQHQNALDLSLIAESERNLRALGIFTDVNIVTRKAASDSLQTRDKWTTKLNTTYRLVGGVHFWGVSLVEDNVFGLGKTIDIGYNHSSDRILRQVLYRDPRLLGSRFGGNVKAQNNSDFDTFEMSLSRPFFAWNTRWGFGLAFENTKGVYRQFRDGELVAAPRLDENALQMIFNLYRGDKLKRHLMFGYNRERSRVGDQRRQLNFFGIGFGVMGRQFQEMHNIDVYERTEDVPSGMVAEIALGANVGSGGRSWKETYLLGRFQYGHADYSSGYSFGTMLQTFYNGQHFRDEFSEGEARAFRKFGRHLLVGRVRFERLAHFSVARQLRLGDENGLRGYPLRARTGSKLLLFNFEDRVATNLKVLVFRLGLTAFADFGQVWETHEPVRLNNLNAAIGLGLRVGNARFTGAINRLDCAYNLSERKWRISVSIGSYFSAYGKLDFLSDFQTNRLRADL